MIIIGSCIYEVCSPAEKLDIGRNVYTHACIVTDAYIAFLTDVMSDTVT